MKTLSITKAMIARLADVSTDGYEIVERSIEDKLLAALKNFSAFATHEEWQLNITAFDKYALVFSMKDGVQYKAEFEIDNNDEPRIIKITPLAPAREIPMQEQIRMRMAADLPITENHLRELKAQSEQEEKEVARKLPFVQLTERLGAGLINGSQYSEQRDQLLLEQHKERNDKKPLLEDGDDSATKRRKLWASRDRGEISLNECLERTAAIRLAEQHGTRRLLSEQQCGDGCDCRDCHLEDFRKMCEARFVDGTMSRAQADDCYARRCVD